MSQPEHAKTSLPMSDAEKAKKLLEGNLVNIGKKVLAGQTLNANEVKILEQKAVGAKDSGGSAIPDNAPALAKNQTQLAEILGVSRKTIQRKIKLPNAPKTKPNGGLAVAEWKAFLASEGVIHETEDLDKAALQAQQILLQNERLRHKLAIEKKEWIPRAVSRQVFTQLITEAKARSFNSVIRLVTLARVAQNTTDAAVEVRKEIEQVWRSLENSEWFKPPTAS